MLLYIKSSKTPTNRPHQSEPFQRRIWKRETICPQWRADLTTSFLKHRKCVNATHTSQLPVRSKNNECKEISFSSRIGSHHSRPDRFNSLTFQGLSIYLDDVKVVRFETYSSIKFLPVLPNTRVLKVSPLLYLGTVVKKSVAAKKHTQTGLQKHLLFKKIRRCIRTREKGICLEWVLCALFLSPSYTC